MQSNVRSIIRSATHFVPNKCVTNDDLAKLMDTSDQWITERTGIKERRFIDKAEITTSDLGYEAALKALDRSGWQRGEVDLLIAATLSPDLYFPGIGTKLQQRLGLSHIPALDIRAQCSGFVYGIATADAFIRSNQAKKVLLVCAEVQSPVLEMNNHGREMAVLFGDGAGAITLEATSDIESEIERGVIDSLLGSDGAGIESLCMKAPGTATPGFIRHEDFDAGAFHPMMEGRVVFKHAITRLVEVSKAIMQRNDITSEQIDLLVPHQANLRINEMVREGLGIAPERAFNNIQKYGNTTAATIPICLSEAVEQGKLKPGMLVLTVAFGAGFTWGANLIRW